jgi:alkylhydroperoxidase/carboxymuconolactone decarboxylase family protein YurZ
VERPRLLVLGLDLLEIEIWLPYFAQASALDDKTAALAYLAVLAALRIESGVPFHVQAAKKAGATRHEVVSAILVGLPAAGQVVTQVLTAAVAAYDAD